MEISVKTVTDYAEEHGCSFAVAHIRMKIQKEQKLKEQHLKVIREASISEELRNTLIYMMSRLR